MRDLIWGIVIITSLITFFYPIIMSFIWLLGGIIFNYQRRNQKIDYELEELPIDIVMPVFNEGAKIATFIEKNLNINYDNYRLIIIDDCSIDDSFYHIMQVAHLSDKIIVHQMEHNSGKANVLNYAVKELVKSDYFLCIDSDAVIDKNALKVLNWKIQTSKTHYSAITGYPNMLNESNDILHLSQEVEYRAIIGTIKKAQSVFGSIMTVSGVCTAYYAKDIQEINYFDSSNATEDIEITWRLQRNDYKVLFLPEMIVNMYSPDYVHELLTQRSRWTLGGLQTFIKNRDVLVKRGHLMLKFFLIEAVLSTIWTFSFIISSFFLLFMIFFDYPGNISSGQILSVFFIMLSVSIVYLVGSYLIDKNKSHKIGGNFIKVIMFYPFIYWFLYPIGYCMGFVRLIKSYTKKNEASGTWRGANYLNDDDISLKSRYLFSLFFDGLIIMMSYTMIRLLLLEFVGPFLKTDTQFLVFLITFTLFFIAVFLFILVYFPMKLGATPGQKLLGIMRVKNNCHKINLLQALVSPLNFMFILYFVTRFSVLATGLAAMNDGDSATFYYQYLHVIEFATASLYQSLAIIVLFSVDAMLCNYVNKTTNTKIIKAYNVNACLLTSHQKFSTRKKIKYILVYTITIVLTIFLFIQGSIVRYYSLYPTSDTCTTEQIITAVSDKYDYQNAIVLNEQQINQQLARLDGYVDPNYQPKNLTITVLKDDLNVTQFVIIDFGEHIEDYNDFMTYVGPYLYILSFDYSIEKNTNRIYLGKKEFNDFKYVMNYVDRMMCD